MLRKAFTLFIMFVPFLIAAQSAYFAGNGGKGKIVLIEEPTMVNGLKNGSDKWLSQSVKTDVLSDLSQYSAIKILESEQQKNVLKLQKESESIIYDESDTLELGRMLKAREYVKITITRIDKQGESLYGLQATIVNIESGSAEGSYNPKTYYSQTDFLTKAHGELSSGILEELGVELTETGKRLISKASEMKATGGTTVRTQNIAVVSAKELKDAQDNLNAIDIELARMQEKLAQIEDSSAFDLEKEAEKLRLENQQATLLQQQKAESEHIARMKADAEKRAIEAEESKKRSAEQQQKIDEIASEIEAKSAEILAKAERNGVEELVVTLEKQKSVYAQNQRRINDSIAAANAGIEAEKRVAIREKKAEPPRKADLNSDGSLSENGKKALDAAITAIEKKYSNMKDESAAEITKSFSDMQTPLWDSILNDKESIEKGSYIASTLDKKLILSVKDYDGTAQGWYYDLAMTFNSSTIYTESGILSYKDITGKDAPKFPDSEDKKFDEKVKIYNEFQDDVELFDSFFRTGVPFITANISYKIKAAPYNRPSEYDITLEKLSFTNLQQNKETSSRKIKENTVYKYFPVTFIDSRTDKEKATEIKKNERHHKSILNKVRSQRKLGASFGEHGWVGTVIAVITAILGIIIFISGGGWIGCLAVLIIGGLILGGVQSCGKKLLAKANQSEYKVQLQKEIERYIWKTYEKMNSQFSISFLDDGEAQLSTGNKTVKCRYDFDLNSNLLLENEDENLSFNNSINDVLLLNKKGESQYYNEIWFDSENTIAKGNEGYVVGMTFSGKWSNKYNAKITFKENGKASVKFSDGDTAEGDYLLNRNGSVIVYNHRNKGNLIVFSIEYENTGNEISSITLCTPSGEKDWSKVK